MGEARWSLPLFIYRTAPHPFTSRACPKCPSDVKVLTYRTRCFCVVISDLISTCAPKSAVMYCLVGKAMSDHKSDECKVLAASVTATFAAIEVLVNCLQENGMLQREQYSEALRKHMSTPKLQMDPIALVIICDLQHRVSPTSVLSVA